MILDNAFYHHTKDDTFINFKNADPSSTRSELVKFYKKHIKLDSFKVKRNNKMKTFTVRKKVNNEWIYDFGKRVTKLPPNYPTRNELNSFIKKWVRENKPDILKNALVKTLEKNDGIVMYTPPYCPDFQPIELVWAYVKNLVAKNWEPDRSLARFIELTWVGFNGHDGLKIRKGTETETVLKTVGVSPYVPFLIDHSNKIIADAATMDAEELSVIDGFCGIYLNPRSKEVALAGRTSLNKPDAKAHDSKSLTPKIEISEWDQNDFEMKHNILNNHTHITEIDETPFAGEDDNDTDEEN